MLACCLHFTVSYARCFDSLRIAAASTIRTIKGAKGKLIQNEIDCI